MDSSNDLPARIATAKAAVLAHTDLMHRELGRARSEWKSDGTRVTPVDLAISAGITEAVAAAFPEDQVFSEELAPSVSPIPRTARFCWVLDPIDGTNNYAAGIADCAISLGLFEHGRPVYGVVYDLARRTLIHGGPGFGAWDGERAATVKATPPDGNSLLGFHTPMDKTIVPRVAPLLANFKFRGLGSSTLHLAYVAIGLLDGVVDHNVRIWDIAGPVPIAMAAGADVQSINGPQFPLDAFDLKMPRIHYVAGSAAMCARLRELLGE